MAAKFWRNVRHDIRVYAASLKVQFKAAAVLRGAFIAQILGMILNNLGLVAAWAFFFERFGTVQGWGLPDFVAMQGMAMIVFGIMLFCCVGFMDLPRHVDSGSFDGFLTKPASVMGQVGSSNIDITTIGDVLLGVVLVGWYIGYTDANMLSILLMLAASVSALVIFWCFVMVLPYVIAFYMFDSERLSRYAGIIFLDGMNYPSGTLTGKLRMVFLAAIPALMVGVVPVDALRGLRWEWVGYGALLAFGWLVFTLWIFKKALRKYESANLIGAR
ncbi:MAG TPA: ABC-2 family transporter protein [Candidatus Saccharimonadales bacterium]|nr:ABC-2 family transporter protein [Candidatus Saccharimonadales bacterium]